MKQRDLIKLLEKNGWVFKRNGGNHDIYSKNGRIEVVPRHKEINENTARQIIKKLGLK